MKIIKFDLPINGIKVKTLDELRDNLTDELVSLARSGQLVRWLKSRQLADVAQAVEAGLAENSSDAALFMAVCAALDVEVHPADVECLFAPAPPAGKKLSTPKAQLAPHLKKAFDLIDKFPEEEFSELEKIIEKSLNDYASKKSELALLSKIKLEGKLISINYHAPRTYPVSKISNIKRIEFLVKDGDKVRKGQKIANLFYTSEDFFGVQIFTKIEAEILSPINCLIEKLNFRNNAKIYGGDAVAIAREIK